METANRNNHAPGTFLPLSGLKELYINQQKAIKELDLSNTPLLRRIETSSDLIYINLADPAIYCRFVHDRKYSVYTAYHYQGEQLTILNTDGFMNDPYYYYPGPICRFGVGNPRPERLWDAQRGLRDDVGVHGYYWSYDWVIEIHPDERYNSANCRLIRMNPKPVCQQETEN